MAKSSNDDIKRALREALTSGLGDFLLQDPTSSESTGRSKDNNQSSNREARNGESNSTGKSNRRSRSKGSRTGARSSRGNSRLLELFRQRLLSRLGADNQRRSGRSRSRRSRRS